MPKVTRKEAALPLQAAAPAAMETEDALPAKPSFAPLTAAQQAGDKIELRRIPVPQNRMTPLKNAWLSLYKPITEHLKLDMRMNLKTKKARAVKFYLRFLQFAASNSAYAVRLLISAHLQLLTDDSIAQHKNDGCWCASALSTAKSHHTLGQHPPYLLYSKL